MMGKQLRVVRDLAASLELIADRASADPLAACIIRAAADRLLVANELEDVHAALSSLCGALAPLA